MQARLRLQRGCEFAKELPPVAPSRTRIGEQVINLVDRGVDGAVVTLGELPNEVTNGEADQPGGHLARRPRAQQGKCVRIVLGQCRTGERRAVGDPANRENVHPKRQDRQNPGMEKGRLSAGHRSDDKHEPVILPELRQRSGLGPASEKTILIGLPKGTHAWIRGARSLLRSPGTPHGSPIRHCSLLRGRPRSGAGDVPTKFSHVLALAHRQGFSDAGLEAVTSTLRVDSRTRASALAEADSSACSAISSPATSIRKWSVTASLMILLRDTANHSRLPPLPMSIIS